MSIYEEWLLFIICISITFKCYDRCCEKGMHLAGFYCVVIGGILTIIIGNVINYYI